MRRQIDSMQDGFTLLEMILVVLLITILIVIAVPNLFAALRVAREGRAVANLKSLVNVQIQFYSNIGRFGIIDELYKRDYLFPGQFKRSSASGGSSGPTETVSDGAYEYSYRYTTDSQGFTLDADPISGLAGSYRRFRYRLSRTASGGISGAMGVILFAMPSTSSPPTAAYKPLKA